VILWFTNEICDNNISTVADIRDRQDLSLRGNGMIEIATSPQERNEFKDGDLVCFCFGYTRRDIEKDYLDNGHSTILERIVFEKKTGGCDCAQKNPKGQ
jgi:hypothetical protein